MNASPSVGYPPALTSEEKEYIVTTIKDWSIQHGLTVRPASSFVSQESDVPGVLATTAPVTLFPTAFPTQCYEQAKSLQTTYNELYAAISSGEEWLREIVEG
jgi:glutathione synthase